MGKHEPGRRRGGGTNLASCALAMAFLLLSAAVLAVVLFVLFRPRDPTIHVDSLQLPAFAAGNGTVSFTFAQFASVHNPNRAAFSHYDSTLRLVLAGGQVGSAFIPAGEIDAGRTQHVAASLAVNSVAAESGGGTLEVVSRMRVTGRIKVLQYFTHHVEATASCRVRVSAGDGAVLGVRC